MATNKIYPVDITGKGTQLIRAKVDETGLETVRRTMGQDTFLVSPINGDFVDLNTCLTYIVEQGVLLNGHDITILHDSGIYIDGYLYDHDLSNIRSLTIIGCNGTTFYRDVNILNEELFKFKNTDVKIYNIKFDTNSTNNISAIVTNTNNWIIENCQFDNFVWGVSMQSNTVSLQISNNIFNCKTFGIEVGSTTNAKTLIDIQYNTFNSTDILRSDINLSNAKNINLIIKNNKFIGTNTTTNKINYNGTDFQVIELGIISDNFWNGNGLGFINGFDFSRSDGRDANIIMENNTLMEDKIFHAYGNLTNNVTSQVIPANTWTKILFTPTSHYACKALIGTNSIQKLSPGKQDITIVGSGSIYTTSQSASVQLALIKNGDTAIQYGLTYLILDTNNRQFQWATNTYIPEFNKNDYLEIYMYCTDGETIVFENFNWMVREI